MRPDLSRRLGAAFCAGFPTPEQRQLVIDAAETAGVATFDDLPEPVRDLVLELERGAG